MIACDCDEFITIPFVMDQLITLLAFLVNRLMQISISKTFLDLKEYLNIGEQLWCEQKPTWLKTKLNI